MSATELLEPFNRMLAEAASPAVLRAIEAGGSPDALWAAIEASGFLDALVPETAGGVGLALADVGPLLMAVGRHAVPVPVGETIIARALLSGAAVACPAGPIALATAVGSQTLAVPCARVAHHILIDLGARCVLVPVTGVTCEATGVALSLAAPLSWSGPLAGAEIDTPAGGLRPLAAMIRAAAIAGAAERVLEMTVAYANDRIQFGKPIGKQQALQQSMAVMAEQAIACRLAAQSVCASALPPPLALVAMAKQVTSAAAPLIANAAHAVHGAMGISAEYDLHLYTRRLHEWRLADGSESFWAQWLGADRLAQRETSVDYIRRALVA